MSGTPDNASDGPVRTRRRRAADTGAIAVEIARLIRREAMARGDRLVELRLAQELGLSRPLVRRALTDLMAEGLVTLEHGRGFTLSCDWQASAIAALADEAGADEAIYLRIAADRLAGRLAEVVTESAMVRDYGVSRTEAARLLARMAREGWVERRTGYGWQFQPTFPSRRAYLQGYRFRVLIEPAALLEPEFAIDPATFERLAASQQRMIDTPWAKLSIATVFDNGCFFHEELARCSGNPFMVDAIKRINRMRRLIEYRALDREAVLAQSREHLAILDLLAQGARAEAAEMMRRHLSTASAAKLDKLDADAVWGDLTPSF
jgi:DNA-binding GntR family transcriptional regulator